MSETSSFQQDLTRRKIYERLFSKLCLVVCMMAIAVLGVLLARVLMSGWSWLSFRLFSAPPSILTPEKSGVNSALLGTVWLISLTSLFSVPVGIAAAIYLEEYATQNRLTRFIQVNIANLAGVPSIVYGILGLAVFVRMLELKRSVLSGALTMSLLILPVIIIASREALLGVPQSIRAAAFALGATRWQTIRHHVLPAALPGIMTGVILALSRAIGEAAPLIIIGALTYIRFAPSGPLDQFTALPIQIYVWSDLPQPIFHELAAAGIIVLLAILFVMNATAVALRTWRQRTKAW